MSSRPSAEAQILQLLGHVQQAHDACLGLIGHIRLPQDRYSEDRPRRLHSPFQRQLLHSLKQLRKWKIAASTIFPPTGGAIHVTVIRTHGVS